MMESIFWMDGYGPYVWAAWLIAGLFLKGLLAWTFIVNTQTRQILPVPNYSIDKSSDKLNNSYTSGPI